MLARLFGNWWQFVLRGLLAILFGILALVLPGVTLVTLVFIFGIFALLEGIFSLFTGIAAAGSKERWFGEILGGIAGIIVAVLTFFWPGMTVIVLLWLIAAWAVVTGIFGIVAAMVLRKVITGEWMMVLAGILSILLGIVLFARPGAGVLAVIWLIGLYAIILGLIRVILGFRLRALSGKIQKAA